MAKKQFKFRIPQGVGLILIALVMLAAGYLLQYVWYPDGWVLGGYEPVNRVSEIAPVSSVYISEVMSANTSAWADDEGLYPDWVELYNAGNAPVNLKGWVLTDNPNRKIQFTFPDYELGAGQTVLVYCSASLRQEAGRAFHAPFKLSRTGDALLLYDETGSIMESVNIPALGVNRAYARKDSTGAWGVTDEYTPGRVNKPENHMALTAQSEQSDMPVVISEIMADNSSTVKDASGQYSDYIELYNPSAEDIDLSGCALSDDAARPLKWRFADGTVIGAGAYLLVFASGAGETVNGEPHANFKLNAEGETVTLTDASGRAASQVTYSLLKADKSVSLLSDGSYAATLPPTPGGKNQ